MPRRVIQLTKIHEMAIRLRRGPTGCSVQGSTLKYTRQRERRGKGGPHTVGSPPTVVIPVGRIPSFPRNIILEDQLEEALRHNAHHHD
jgi:hypothetical protein